MSAAAIAPYSVDAYNMSWDSENKIHDDAVAKRFGFSGGLVPGVDVYGYMTHQAVGRWSRAWLAHGTADCRFIKPVYDGKIATVTAAETADGLDIVAWYQPPASAEQPVVLFFHGNSGNIGHRGGRIAHNASHGWGTMLPEYRGFGGNPGSPSEEGLALDAEAAYGALRADGIAPERIVIWGESLGTAVATRLAAAHPASALILEAPFTSMADIARSRYPFVPVNLLLKDRFDTLSRISAVTIPLLIIHGDQDKMIPIDMGRHVFEAATTPNRVFWVAEDAGHNNLGESGAHEAAHRFLDRYATPAGARHHIAQR